MPETRLMSLPDGRALGWKEFGAPEGACVVLLHGTPGSASQLVFDGQTGSEELRCFSIDRPGYGLSSYDAERTFTSFAKDIEAFADRIGLAGFRVLGLSGGGPNALACAAVLGDRVTATALVSSVAPRTSGTTPGPVVRAARSVRRRAGAELQVRLQRRSPARSVDAFVRMLPPADAAIVGRTELRRRFEEEAAALSRTAARTIAQDRTLSSGDWGIDVARVTGAVHVWHGTEDRSVPIAAARTLCELMPAATYHEVEGAGHFFLFERFAEVAEALVAPPAASPASPLTRELPHRADG